MRLEPPGPEPAGLGRFGEFGGRFVPETLVPALIELEDEFRAAWRDDDFRAEFAELLGSYAGRPTPVTECHRLSERLGLRVLLEARGPHPHRLAQDQQRARPGADHPPDGQAARDRRDRGRASTASPPRPPPRCSASTASCSWARSTSSARRSTCSACGSSAPRSCRSPRGSATLKDAINEALRDWVATVESTHYCLGSVVGPHPFPWMVREFQRVVGDEARAQCRAILDGADPDVVVACVGGGSNAIGTFAGFLDTDARLVGVEPGGHGLESGSTARR